MDITLAISRATGFSYRNVAAVIEMLETGDTIPFISRYRKEATGGLDEVAIFEISRLKDSFLALEKRRKTIIDTITEQGQMTPELLEKIENAEDNATLEDIYLPYKPKRRTRAQIAREKGLENLAKILMAQRSENLLQIARKFINENVASPEDAINGAKDIAAEWISERENVRKSVRARFLREAKIVSSVVPGEEENAEKYRNYFEFSEPLSRCPSHRYLAMRRGEAEGFLKVGLKIDDNKAIERISEIIIKKEANSDFRRALIAAITDSYKRLIRPTIETEVAALAREKAEESAIKAFADNVEQLLMSPPLRGGKRVLAIDPGFRTGCKVVCLDAQGNLLHFDVIYPTAPQNDVRGASRKISNLIETYDIDAIALGNGTASRETEHFLQYNVFFPREVNVYVVSEDGASVYSASKVARDEFPDKDVTVRGAVSIGRRLIDPLAELVKIDPKSIGVGQYQHDVDQANLKASLDNIVMKCVNRVGVDINTASPQLLAYVAGIGPSLAANIVKYRAENGDFTSREQLKKVPRLGDKAFQQCAGFMRIPGAENPLDNTAVHPERYAVVDKIAKDMGIDLAQLIRNDVAIRNIDLEKYVTDDCGLPTLTDIAAELEKPGRDPRSKVAIVEFDKDITSIEDLVPGMELNGIVNNITDFGAFVDIGIKQSGLVHVSQMAEKRVSSPHDVVKLHQAVKVKVLDVDVKRGRISLTMKGLS
ncbi:MAG: Tex family protein [Muribaculaceae bacterium]